MLFNEPKLLKFEKENDDFVVLVGFSALQRAEIAEMEAQRWLEQTMLSGFSALQRAEIAEILSTSCIQ